MKTRYVLTTLILLACVSALVVATENQDTPVVAVELDNTPIYNQERITHESTDGKLQAIGSANIESILLNVRRGEQTIHSNQSRNPAITFELPEGSYEVNVIGYQDNEWAASAKIFLEIAAKNTEENTTNKTTTNITAPPQETNTSTKKTFIEQCNYYNQRQENRAYQREETRFKIVHSTQANLNYTQRYSELQAQQANNQFVFLKDPQGAIHATGLGEKEKTHLNRFSSKTFEVRVAEDFCTEIQRVIDSYEETPSNLPEELTCAQQEKQQLQQATQRLDTIEAATELYRTECNEVRETVENRILAIQALQKAGADTKKHLEETIEEFKTTTEAKEEVIDLYFIYANYLHDVGECTQLESIVQEFSELEQATTIETGPMRMLVHQCAAQKYSCRLYEGNPNAPVKIVLVPDRFNSMQEFYSAADKGIQMIFTNEILQEHQEKFAFYYLETILDLGIDRQSAETLRETLREPIREKTRFCEGFPTVITRDDIRSFAFRSELAVASWPLVSEISDGKRSWLKRHVSGGAEVQQSHVDFASARVVLHEINHLVFHLPDLYVEQGKGSRPSFTCQPSREQAQIAWSDVPDAEYVQGCSFIEENIRSSEESIMRNHAKTAQYSPAGNYYMRQWFDVMI